MQPMSKQPKKPTITIGDPEIFGNTHRVTLTWNGFSHDIDTRIPDEADRPSKSRLMESLNKGIDRFHRKIRNHLRPEGKEDEIRQV